MVTATPTPESTPASTPQPVAEAPAAEPTLIDLLGTHTASLSVALEGLSTSNQAKQTAVGKVARLQEQLTAAQTTVTETQAEVNTAIDAVIGATDGLTAWLGTVRAELQSAKVAGG